MPNCSMYSSVIGLPGAAGEVHLRRAVLAHGGVQRVVQRLHVHGHALDLVLDEPLAGLDAGAAGVLVVVLGVVEQAVHAGVEADDHALELFRLDVRALAGVLEMLGQDQAPLVDLDLEADGVAGVGVDRHLVGVASPLAGELLLHDVTRSVGVGAGVLHAVDALGEDAALGHGVHRVDDRLHEVRPTRDLSAERMCQINPYLRHSPTSSPSSVTLLLTSGPAVSTGSPAPSGPGRPCTGSRADRRAALPAAPPSRSADPRHRS